MSSRSLGRSPGSEMRGRAVSLSPAGLRLAAISAACPSSSARNSFTPLRMHRRQIVRLADVRFQVVQLESFLGSADELPPVSAHACVLVEQELMRRACVRPAQQNVECVLAVNAAIGRVPSHERRQRRQDVDCRDDLIRRPACRDRPGPPRDCRLAHVALVLGTAFSAPQRAHAHAAGAAVVRREDDQGLLPEVERSQRVENASDAVVDLLHNRPVYISPGPFSNLRACVSRAMDVCVGQIEKEGFGPMSSNEVVRCVGDGLGEQRLVRAVRHVRHHLVVPNDWQGSVRLLGVTMAPEVPRPHVVRIRNSKVLVEAVLERQVLRLVAEMPFAECACGVARPPHDLRDRGLVRVEAAPLARKKHVAVHADPMGERPGHQGRARRRAIGVRDVELAKDESLRRHSIKMGGLVDGRTEGADVSVAQVVDQDEHDVGLRPVGGGEGRRWERECCGQRPDMAGERHGSLDLLETQDTLTGSAFCGPSGTGCSRRPISPTRAH